MMYDIGLSPGLGSNLQSAFYKRVTLRPALASCFLIVLVSVSPPIKRQ